MSRRALAVVVLVFLAWGALGIWRSSFTLGGERWFPLADDQMVSMRFAKHLAEGQGLVWNTALFNGYPGAHPNFLRVEGFSNPLWTGVMALVHLTGSPVQLLGLWVKLLALFCLVANLVVVRRMAHEVAPEQPVAAWTAVALAAASAPLLYWAVMGFEVALLVLLVDLALLGLVRWQDPADRRALLAPSAWLALAVWVRLDAVVAVAVAVVYVAWRGRERWLRCGLVPVVVVGASLALQTAARLAYYGDWVPNTYHLKMTGYPEELRVATGAIWLALTLKGPGLLVLASAFGLAAWRGDGRMRLLVGLLLAQAAYSVWVGGDAWEENGLANRFLAIGLPALAVLIGWALARLVGRSAFSHPAVAALLIVLAAVALEGKGDPDRTVRWLAADLPYKADDYRELTALSKAVADVTTPNANVAVVWAGLLPYLTDLTCIDLLGKSDHSVVNAPARTFEQVGDLFQWRNPTHDEWGHFYPGHLKWHYPWSIGRLKPDVIAQQWGPPADLAPYLGDYQPVALGGDPRLTVALRKGSPNVRWDVVSGAR